MPHPVPLTPALTAAIVVTSAYNLVNLTATNSRGPFVWGIVLCVGVPILAIAPAWYLTRSETPGPSRLRPSALILSGVGLAQGAMLPLTERLRASESDDTDQRG